MKTDPSLEIPRGCTRGIQFGARWTMIIAQYLILRRGFWQMVMGFTKALSSYLLPRFWEPGM